MLSSMLRVSLAIVLKTLTLEVTLPGVDGHRQGAKATYRVMVVNCHPIEVRRCRILQTHHTVDLSAGWVHLQGGNGPQGSPNRLTQGALASDKVTFEREVELIGKMSVPRATAKLSNP